MPTKKATNIEKPVRPLYGIPIYDAIKRGDAREMKALAAEARKHVSDLKKAIAALEKKIGAA